MTPPGDEADEADEADPVRARRERIAVAARVGQRIGYGLFVVSLGLLVVGIAFGFTPVVAAATTACLVGGSVVLAPAIIVGFAVRAAERDDQARGL
ncbi:MAG: hypothetical protein ACRD29_06660 [Acidimicrobiales bacterium]